MASPYFSAYDTIGTPNGTWVKPGGQVVAYVRSTGVQSGDLPEVAVNMVATIALGVARCRAGFNDIVVVLPGHTETLTGTTSLFTAVSGAQIIGAGNPGAANAPNVTISAVGAGIALSAANMTIAGLNINSATAAVTGAIVITGAGVTLANNFISFTGALAANVAIQVTAAATARILDNYISVSSTGSIVSITGASSNYLVHQNFFRQLVSGAYVTSDATATGIMSRNLAKSATAAPAAGAGFVGSAAVTGNFENYSQANAVTAGVIATGS